MHPDYQTLRTRLAEVALPEQAAPMAAYMKHHFVYLGVKSPQRKAVQNPWIKETMQGQKIVPQALGEALWEAPEREFQYVAIDLLQKYARYGPAAYLDWYESLILRKSWWDSVDMLCNVIWKHFLQHPHQRLPYSKKWIESEHLWLQRTALLFQLKAREQTDWPLLQSFILKTCHSKEFFIQKAIGWTLRQYSKTAPEEVRAFLSQHRSQLAPLSIREGSKYL